MARIREIHADSLIKNPCDCCTRNTATENVDGDKLCPGCAAVARAMNS